MIKRLRQAYLRAWHTLEAGGVVLFILVAASVVMAILVVLLILSPIYLVLKGRESNKSYGQPYDD